MISNAILTNMNVQCPTCKKEVQYEGNPFRPFCSERCQLLDLGDWASEKFSVPVHEFDSSKQDVQSPNKNDEGFEDD